jgi:ADP-ribose pyrophosphatase YjhB (NUDIX family)
MDKKLLLQQLNAHQSADVHEEKMRQQITAFVQAHEMFYARSLQIGHLTGSAWIVDADRSQALLTHHGKLNLWVQLGGHVENDADMLSAAWREAREESGLHEIHPLSENIFDVDVHAIPANGCEPAHYHYDVRFLFQADRNAPLTITSESKSLAWMALDRIGELTSEESVLRMIRKTNSLIASQLLI